MVDDDTLDYQLCAFCGNRSPQFKHDKLTRWLQKSWMELPIVEGGYFACAACKHILDKFITTHTTKAEEGDDMKLDYEKYMSTLYMALYECAAAPAAITEQMATEMAENIVKMREKCDEALNDKGRLNAHLTEIYNSLYDRPEHSISPEVSIISGMCRRIDTLRRDREELKKDKERLDSYLVDVHIALYGSHEPSIPTNKTTGFSNSPAMVNSMCTDIIDLRRSQRPYMEVNEQKEAAQHLSDLCQMFMGEHKDSSPRIQYEALKNHIRNRNDDCAHHRKIREALEKYLYDLCDMGGGAGGTPEQHFNRVKKRLETARKDKDAEDQIKLNASICAERRRFKEALEAIYECIHGSKPTVALDKYSLESLVRKVTALAEARKSFAEKQAKLENKLAVLNNETSGLRFSESRALEKRVDAWADKAIEYRTLLGAVVRNLRCKENMSEVADLADFLEEELKK